MVHHSEMFGESIVFSLQWATISILAAVSKHNVNLRSVSSTVFCITQKFAPQGSRGYKHQRSTHVNPSTTLVNGHCVYLVNIFPASVSSEKFQGQPLSGLQACNQILFHVGPCEGGTASPPIMGFGEKSVPKPINSSRVSTLPFPSGMLERKGSRGRCPPPRSSVTTWFQSPQSNMHAWIWGHLSWILPSTPLPQLEEHRRGMGGSSSGRDDALPRSDTALPCHTVVTSLLGWLPLGRGSHGDLLYFW